jgi:hypothetical protein
VNDPAELLDRYVAAINSHDPERVMACYADSIHFVLGAGLDLRGRDKLQPIADWDACLNTRLSVSEVRIIEDTANFRLAERNDWFRLAGLEEAIYEPAWIRFRDGLVVEVHAEQDPGNRDRFLPTWQDVMAWVKERHPEALRELMPGGKFVYGGDQARRWLTLLEERAAE